MKAGDKVVCVDDALDAVNRQQRQDGYWPSAWPKKGRVYVVRDAFIYDGRPMLRLVGIIGPVHQWAGIEGAFAARRFRPVAEVGHPPIKVERPQELEARPC